MTTVRAPQAFLFDLDGTLVDTVGTRVDAWMETFPRFGIAPERAYLAPLMGSDGRLLARTVAEHYGQPLDPGVDAQIDREAGERFGELNARPRALPGSTEILEFLTDADMPWAIATSSRPEEALASVESLGLRMRPLISDGDAVEHAKPAPDLLLQSVGQLGIDPVDTWYVGDSKWDMLAAVAARMVAIGIPTGATSADELADQGADMTFQTLSEFLTYLESDALAPDRGVREVPEQA